MRSELEQMKGELKRVGGRLDRCEAGAAAFGQDAVAVVKYASGRPTVEPADLGQSTNAKAEGQPQTNATTAASVLHGPRRRWAGGGGRGRVRF